MLFADKRWIAIITYGITGAIVLIAGIGILWFMLIEEGDNDLWNLCIEWQFGNRMTYQKGDKLFYLIHSYLMFAPASLPFVYSILFAKKKLFSRPILGMILFVLFIEIILTIPNCQHLRYMTLALPPMILVGAWGLRNIQIKNAKLLNILCKIWKLAIIIICIGILPSFAVCAAICIVLKMQLSFINLSIGVILTALLVFAFKPWKASLPNQFAFAFITIFFVLCFQILPIIEAAEKTYPSVKTAESISNGSPVYFYFIDADHDGVKDLAAIDRKRVKDIVFINHPDSVMDKIPEEELVEHPLYDSLCSVLNIHQLTEEECIDYLWHTYNYKTEEEVLTDFKKGIFIVRDKTAALEQYQDAMATYGISVQPVATIKLGHKKYKVFQ